MTQETQHSDYMHPVPVIMLVCGLPGSGKTTLVNRVKELIKDRCLIVSVDQIASLEEQQILVSSQSSSDNLNFLIFQCRI